MDKDTVIELKKPIEESKDPLTEILRKGAKKLLAAALEAEIEDFLSQYKRAKDSKGKQRVTRNGYLPERSIQTGIGGIKVRAPRVRDRQPDKDERIEFSSNILPKYLRRTKSMEELIPWLYLKGISTGDFSEALSALLGKDAPGLSSGTISRLKAKWQDEYTQWKYRDISFKRYVYFWADGLYCNVRMEEKQCLLVIIGVTSDGKKELITIEDGYRESEQSWLEVLTDLKKRGLIEGPQLAVGDGSLGFWKAMAQVYPNTRWQRCWVHKTANVLNKLPKSLQNKAKEKLHEIWRAENKKMAEKNFNAFIQTYEAKYPKAVKCLEKDRDVLLAFYDFPAEHWRHIRTTNPIESTFSTVRLRTAKVRNCFSSQSVLSMAFKLCQCAEKKWIRIHKPSFLTKLLEGIRFIDGIEENDERTERIAA